MFKGFRLQGDAAPPREDENCGKRSSKRRKVSLAEDTKTPAFEVKAGSADDNAVIEASNKGVYEARWTSVCSSLWELRVNGPSRKQQGQLFNHHLIHTNDVT